MFNHLTPILAETTAPAEVSPLIQNLIMWGPIVLIVVLMYFVMIRPQRKKQKEEQKMRNSIRVGDEITTIGGICGRVINIKEDALVIETGADRSKMTIKNGRCRVVKPSMIPTKRTMTTILTMMTIWMM